MGIAGCVGEMQAVLDDYPNNITSTISFIKLVNIRYKLIFTLKVWLHLVSLEP